MKNKKIIQRLWRQCHINHNHNLNFTEPIIIVGEKISR